MARWLNLVEVSCFDTSRKKEFVDWYENIHLSDILDTPGYKNGKLFQAKEFREGRGHFLTMYEIETEDIDQTITLRREKRLEERAHGRYRDCFIVIWRDVLWKFIVERVARKSSNMNEARWLNLWETYCADPSRENELDKWYDNIHLSDALETPGFLKAGRYERKEFVGGRGKYLIVYDICTEDINKTMAISQAKYKKERESGHHIGFSLDVWRDVLWKLLVERHSIKS